MLTMPWRRTLHLLQPGHPSLPLPTLHESNMEAAESSAGAAAGSAIPRFSRLPQAQPRAGTSHNDYAATPVQAPDPARNSMIQPPRPPSALQKHDAPLSPRKNRSSMLMRPGFGFTSVKTPGTAPKPDTLPESAPAPDREESRDSVANDVVQTPSTKPVRKPRPSLSDRTVKTLSSIPPSPSPKRRQSAFYGNEAPMRPPSRNASALGFARPYSRIADRPSSPDKRATGTFHAPRASVSGRTAPQTPAGKTSSRLLQPRATPVTPKPSGISAPALGSRTLPAKKATRSPVQEAFGEEIPRGPPLGSAVKSLTKSRIGTATVTAKKPPLQGLTKPAALQNSNTPQDTDESKSDGCKVSSSSQNLRDAIAKAKAARRSNVVSSDLVPRAVEDDMLANVGAETDPTTFGLLDSGYVNILRKRITNAKSDGKLNIAALCLTEVPVEVLKMYDHGEEGSSWFENVDVTRLNAADNEFERLPEEVFPLENGRGADESQPREAVFAGLEVIDLHGNRLSSLPEGFGRLSRLTVLNLSRNKLGNSAFEIISRINSLKDLRLAENALEGTLPETISCIEDIELLDLQSNKLTELPSSLGKLSKLKTINVSNNRLAALPLEAIFDLPITEILASRNRISGPFVPTSIPTFPSLQTLDVSTNALTALSDGKVDFPNLRSLNVSFNRISALPDMTRWHELVTLNAEENKISEIPQGFTSLSHLNHADFNFNSLLQLDDSIATMENLQVFRISNNPIRERRLLRLTVPDLKAELRSRSPRLMSPDGQHSDDTASLASFSRSPSGEWSSLANGDSARFSMLSPIPGMSPIERVGLASRTRGFSNTWMTTGDTLDTSNAKLKEIDQAALANAADQDVKAFVAKGNQIQIIPACLQAIGATLTTLDLTNNKLGKAPNGAFMVADLTLPNLVTLNLTSNALTSLEPLVTHLNAPKLATLILLFNRLSALPDVCGRYPALTKLLASNNAVEQLEVAHVRNLQVLDLSSNELVQLPAKLALLHGQLRTLMVGGNKFKVPGWGVLEKGTEEILNWCRLKIPEGENMTL